MKSEKCVNSEIYDSITIIASAAPKKTGYVRICFRNSTMDKQFRYSKCELFTANIPRGELLQISVQDVKIHYSYLFQRGSSKRIRRLHLEKGTDAEYRIPLENPYKNQNVYHYTAPVGWLNDPTGLCFYRGRYHMFYQFNPVSQQWGDAHWGHATSRDLVHWREHPVALSPQMELISNPSARGGAFSGTALVEHDRMHLFFTRHIGDMEKKHCMEYTVTVSSEDGFTFSGEQKAVDALPVELGENFRDPKVWREGEEWMMLTGTETKNSAAISVHCSKDLVNWEYKGIFFQEEERKYLRAECPSIKKIAEKYVLIVGYHNRDTAEIRRDTLYYIGSLKDYKFHVEYKGLLDYGKDFYAAQIFANLERPVLLAWVNDRCAYHIEKLCRSNGIISLPRKLWIEEGKLYSYPVNEVATIETEEARFGHIFSIEDGRGHLHVDLAEAPFGNIRLAGSEAGQISLVINTTYIVLDVDGEKWTTELKLKELDVYMDNSLLEIFLNHGSQTFTRRYERYEIDYKVKANLNEGCMAVFYRIRL